MRLRPATEADAGAIRALVWRANINPTGLKWPRFVVAESDEGDLIACGQVKPHQDGTKELASIVVATEWRGQGVARALIEHLIDTHSGDLYLMCRSGLGPFYDKFGFQSVDGNALPRYFRRILRLSKIGRVLMPRGQYLMIMKREGSA